MSNTSAPSEADIRREVASSLRSTEDPYALTFKQVRLQVEKALRLPEGSLQRESKDQIKNAVHSVMDEIEAEQEGDGGAESSEDESITSGVKSKGAPSKAAVKGQKGPDRKNARVRQSKGESARTGPAASPGGRKSRSTGKDGDSKQFVRLLGETQTRKRQASVGVWNGKFQVNIREYYSDKDGGDFKPTKKGIVLNRSQWDQLVDARAVIDRKIASLS